MKPPKVLRYLKEGQKTLLHDLAWPSAASSVAWSFLTILYSGKDAPPQPLERLAVLGLLSLYLGVGWIMSRRTEMHEVGPLYWLCDATHVLSISVFAIATQMNQPQLSFYLALVFIVPMFGHASGVWLRKRDATDTKIKKRLCLASVNGCGLLCLWIEQFLIHKGTAYDYWFNQEHPTHNLSRAVAVVLVAWVIIREWLPEEPA